MIKKIIIIAMIVTILSGCAYIRDLYGEEPVYVPLASIPVEEVDAQILCTECDYEDLSDYYYDCTEWDFDNETKEYYLVCRQHSYCNIEREQGKGECFIDSYMHEGKQYHLKHSYTYIDSSVPEAIVEFKKEVGIINIQYPEAPLKEICYNSSYDVHKGEINKTCYLFGAMDRCKKREINDCLRIFGNSELPYCTWDYIDCVEDYRDDMFDKLEFDRYYANEWDCLLNKTTETHIQESCYEGRRWD